MSTTWREARRRLYSLPGTANHPPFEIASKETIQSEVDSVLRLGGGGGGSGSSNLAGTNLGGGAGG